MMELIFLNFFKIKGKKKKVNYNFSWIYLNFWVKKELLGIK